MTQQELDIWLAGCLTYYNNNSKIKTMSKTIEERMKQLETAHSRLHNLLMQVQTDITNINNRNGNHYLELSNKLNDLTKLVVPEDTTTLPDEMKNGVEYKAIVAEILKTKDVKWQNMDYTNWEIKLVGKEEYVHIAFIPTGTAINAGDKVRFTYAAPFQCKKLIVM